MRGFWTGRRRFGRVSGPRPGAPEARVDFVRGLTEYVSESRRNTQSVRFRLAFAGVLSLMLLGSLAAFGGVSSAATGFMGHPAKALKASLMWHAKGLSNNAKQNGAARQNGAVYSPSNHQYDDDDDCQRGHDDRERRNGRHHQNEDRALAAHQTQANHRNMNRAQRDTHFRAENLSLDRHQNSEDDDEDDEDDRCEHRHHRHHHGHHHHRRHH